MHEFACAEQQVKRQPDIRNERYCQDPGDGRGGSTPLLQRVGCQHIDEESNHYNQDMHRKPLWRFQNCRYHVRLSDLHSNLTIFLKCPLYEETSDFGGNYIWMHNNLSLIHISEPTRLGMISYAV